MTSKTLWNKLLGFQLKQRIWLYVISLLVLLFAMPVSLLMTIDSFELNGFMIRSELIENLIDYVDYGYGMHGALTLMLGFVAAFFCFGFVYSKSMLDLYHSLPVRREKLYAMKYIAGLVPGILVQILTGLLSFAILIAKGYLTPDMTRAMLFVFVQNILAYLMAFNVVIIAIMLTGRLIVGILGGMTLLAFVPFTTVLVQGYCSACYQTYWDLTYTSRIWYMLLNPLSAVMMDKGDDRVVLRCVLIAIEAVVFCLIGLYLYIKRPSEAANKSLCHNVSKHIIRVPLVILAALAGGVYVSFMFNSLPAVWYWTAFLVAGIVAHIALELIFEQEAKGIYRHPVQLVASLLIACAISLTFQYDLTGYDRYLPDEADLQEVSVRLSSIESEISHFKQGEKGWEYTDYTSILEDVASSEPAAILNMAKQGIASLDPERSAIARRQNSMRGDSEALDKEQMIYLIRYKLRSGREVYRSYYADIDGMKEDVAKVYEDPAYKDYLYQVDEFIDTEAIKTLSARTWDDNLAFDNTQINVRAFLEAYKEDLAKRTLKDLEAIPVLRLSSYDQTTYFDFLSGYYLYESDKNTMEYLAEAGIDTNSFACRLDADQISQITVHDYSVRAEEEEYEPEFVMEDYAVIGGYDGQDTVYTQEMDADQIAHLAEIMVPETFSYNNGVLHPTCMSISMEVIYTQNMNSGCTAFFALPYGETY